VLSIAKLAQPASDDELDARVAYALGCLWMKRDPSVALLGDSDLGAFLLPTSPRLEKEFQTFRNDLVSRRPPEQRGG
jgi:hypothetical protein